jgi:hypothetical protein
MKRIFACLLAFFLSGCSLYSYDNVSVYPDHTRVHSIYVMEHDGVGYVYDYGYYYLNYKRPYSHFYSHLREKRQNRFYIYR